jgi:hypothetical protein
MAPAYRTNHRARAAQTRGMSPGRDPATELSERARDLVDAAEGMRRAAATPGSSPAVAASLGCLEAALDELAAAATNLGVGVVASSQMRGRTATGARDIFERLSLQLTLARSSCGAARESAGPLAGTDPSPTP